MSKIKLPFTIGEQYELHEFGLKDETTTKLGNYEFEVYSCNSDLFEKIKIEGLTNVLLFYNADILGRIEYRFNINFIKSVMNLFIPSKNEDIITLKYSEDYIDVVITHSKYSR